MLGHPWHCTLCNPLACSRETGAILRSLQLFSERQIVRHGCNWAGRPFCSFCLTPRDKQQPCRRTSFVCFSVGRPLAARLQEAQVAE